MIDDKENDFSPYKDVQKIVDLLRKMNDVLYSEVIDRGIVMLIDQSHMISNYRQKLGIEGNKNDENC